MPPYRFTQEQNMLSEMDYAAIRTLKQCGALVPIEEARLRPGAAVIIGCGDKDRAPEMVDFYREIFRRRNGNGATPAEDAYVHLILLNGGGLLIPERSPLAHQVCCGMRVPMDLAAIQQVKDAVNLKHATIVGVSVHFPCGMAQAHHMRAEDVVDYSIDAKRRLRTEFADAGRAVEVIGFIHVDYEGREARHGGKRFKTYVIKRQQFNEYILSGSRIRRPLAAEAL